MTVLHSTQLIGADSVPKTKGYKRGLGQLIEDKDIGILNLNLGECHQKSMLMVEDPDMVTVLSLTGLRNEQSEHSKGKGKM